MEGLLATEADQLRGLLLFFTPNPRLMFSLKSFSIVAVVLLLVAFAGILSQGGRATAVTWLCVAPLGAWVLFLVVGAVVNGLRDRR